MPSVPLWFNSCFPIRQAFFHPARLKRSTQAFLPAGGVDGQDEQQRNAELAGQLRERPAGGEALTREMPARGEGKHARRGTGRGAAFLCQQPGEQVVVLEGGVPAIVLAPAYFRKLHFAAESIERRNGFTHRSACRNAGDRSRLVELGAE